MTASKDVKDVLIESIRIDGGTQPRAEINLAVVADYAESLEQGEDLPPVDLFYDGSEYWLADGFHRYHAARKVRMADIPATVHVGTQRDAVLFSVGANASHGLRRSNDDKRRAVLTLLNDPEWSQWSAREIAKKCNVHHSTVSDLRQTVSESDTVSEVKFTTSTGKTAVHKVEPKSKPAPKPQAESPVSVAKPAEPAPPPKTMEDSSILSPPAPKSQFDPTEFDPELNPDLPRREVDRSAELSEKIQQQNSLIESFARGLTKWFDENLPSDPWLDESRVGIARDQVRAAASTLRLTKAHSKPCPKCSGSNANCKFCRGVGYMPKSAYEMAGGV